MSSDTSQGKKALEGTQELVRSATPATPSVKLTPPEVNKRSKSVQSEDRNVDESFQTSSTSVGSAVSVHCPATIGLSEGGGALTATVSVSGLAVLGQQNTVTYVTNICSHDQPQLASCSSGKTVSRQPSSSVVCSLIFSCI